MSAQFADIDITDLAPRLRELVGVIGLPAASKLIKARGGTEIYLPHPGGDDTVLASIVGKDAAEKMIAHYGSVRRLALDRGVRALKAAENRAIVREADIESFATLALRYGRTERAIYKVVARARKLDDKQLALYP